MKLLKQEHNNVTGITEQYWLHSDMKTITVRGVQDADHILNANTQMRNAPRASTKLNENEGLGTLVARIPMGLIEEVNMKTGVNLMNCDQKVLKRFLNSPEYARLRTKEGKI